MLKIAAADKNWLQQLVLTERRRLASLHHAALAGNAPNTETAEQDHEGDKGYEGALADKKESPKTAKVAFHPDDAGVSNDDIETINVAAEHLEDQYPGTDPAKIFNALNNVMTPGMSIEQLVNSAMPMLRVAGAKKADAEKDNTETAKSDHAGDKAYENALDPKVGSTKKAAELKYDESGTPPNTNTATQDHDFELKALAKQISSMLGGKTEWNPNDPLKD